jgi:oligosaccharide reducing-end xylanase
VTRLQNFFAPIAQEDFMAYQLDGTATDTPAMHPVAITAVLGAASIASESPYADEWLRRFWAEPLRKGNRRYYDNCLYFFCLMMLSGVYKIY